MQPIHAFQADAQWMNRHQKIPDSIFKKIGLARPPSRHAGSDEAEAEAEAEAASRLAGPEPARRSRGAAASHHIA